MTMPLHFPNHGHGRILRTDGLDVVLVADFAAPPGRPLSGTTEPPEAPIQIKVKGCRRLGSGEFEIVGRFVSLPRETRERVLTSTDQTKHVER